MARTPDRPGLLRTIVVSSGSAIQWAIACAVASVACLLPLAGAHAQAPASPAVPAVQPPLAATPGSEGVTLNFVNAEIDAVVRAVADITGRNFIVDPRVRGTINIVSARPVPRSLVYPTLLSALRLAGFTAIEGDGIVKIVPEADAKTQGGGVGSGSGDRLVTQVIVLRHESAAQLVNVLRPLITPNNTIAAFPGSNALVITDYASNLRRIERIVASLDLPSAAEPLLVQVKHASALDIVMLVNRLMNEAPAPGGAAVDATQRVTLVADPRSNSVLVRSENPTRAARIRQLIEQLDTPGRPGGNLFIIYLKNADASRVAQTLRALLTGGDGGTAPTTPTSLAPTGAFSVGSAAPAAQPSPAAATTSSLPFTPSGASTGGFNANGVTVQADTANNALIIMAPEPIYNNLRAIVEKLDVRRAQVYVEALIVEVSADKAAELGIQWQALGGLGFVEHTGVRRHELRRARQRHEHHRHLGQSHRRRARPQPRRDPRDGEAAGFSRRDHEPRVPRPGARDAGRREHPLDAGAHDARQRGSADHRRPERPVRHRFLRDDRRHVDGRAVHDRRASRRGSRPSGAPPDHRRGHGHA